MAKGVQFSIVIPTYNYAGTIERAIGSVLPQLNDQCELLVVDDGSTDNTVEVVERLQQSCVIPFQFLQKPNGGAASARNFGIRHTQGQYLVFLDADDELLPDAILLLMSHIEANAGSRFVIAGHVAVSPDGKRREHLPGVLPEKPVERVRAYLLDKTLSLSNGACAMHRSIFDCGVFPESFRSAEDIPVFAQALANFPCSLLPRPLALIHKHDDSLRHQYVFAKAGGVALVDEIFLRTRLPVEFECLRSAYLSQRCLSLFRSAYLAKDFEAAKAFFRIAVNNDWRVIFKFSYLRKAIRLWLR